MVVERLRLARSARWGCVDVCVVEEEVSPMRSAEQASHKRPASESAGVELETLIPIAVVIGAGCETCAGSLVLRARRRGTPEALIARALRIVARVGAVECLARAVGPEVVRRLRRSLHAGERAARQAHGRVKDRGYCVETPTAELGTRPDRGVR
jgi:hypothetical protein